MATLDSIKFLSGLPENDLAVLQKAAREMTFPAGARIFEEGDPGDGLYILKSGEVEISAVLENGHRQTFHHVPAGDIFGEMTVLDEQPRSARATAEQHTTVIFVPGAAIKAVLKGNPDLAITLVRELSARLREFNHHYLREVLQAERLALLGRFASTIVHDLKNPLAVISLAASMAGAPTATAERRKLAEETIGKQVQRVTNLVNDILEYTRGAEALPDFPLLDYGAFLRSVVVEFEEELKLRGVKLQLEGEPPSVQVPANTKRLLRVFYNLFSNAADELPRGGEIRLRLLVEDTEVTTEIEDNGRGIAPEIMEKLFEAFATFGKTKGTGLGLSIAQKIVEDHHGIIAARNSPRGGAVFAFTLPRTRAIGSSKSAS